MLRGFWNAPDQTTPAPRRDSEDICPPFVTCRSPVVRWSPAAFEVALIVAPFANLHTLRIVAFFLVIAMTMAWFQDRKSVV